MDVRTFKRRFGDKVRQARLAAGISQQELASAALTMSLISQLESGKANPTLETVFALARKLDVSVSELCDVEPSPPDRQPLDARQGAPLKRGPKPKAKRLASRGRK